MKFNIKPLIYNFNLEFRNIKFFSKIIYIFKILKKKGYQCYLVGGSIRDLIKNFKPKDFDIITDAQPEKIKLLFKNSIIIGKRFKLIHIFYDKYILEISSFRSLVLNNINIKKIKKNKILFDNSFGNQQKDSKKRDFDINSLLYNPINKRVIDYEFGIKKIKFNQINVIADIYIKYFEDPIRILRLFRFICKLKCNTNSKTINYIDLIYFSLKNVSRIRISEDILKIITNIEYFRQILSKISKKSLVNTLILLLLNQEKKLNFLFLEILNINNKNNIINIFFFSLLIFQNIESKHKKFFLRSIILMEKIVFYVCKKYSKKTFFRKKMFLGIRIIFFVKFKLKYLKIEEIYVFIKKNYFIDSYYLFQVLVVYFYKKKKMYKWLLKFFYFYKYF